jgi:hypothetical protein
LRRGEINMYFSAAAASSADDTHSMQEKFTLTDAGDLTLYGDVNVNLNDTAANFTIISASGQYDDSDDAKSVFELKYYGQGAFHTHRVGSSWQSIIENPNSGGTMEWWINGGQKLELDNSGNFGIGTGNPAQKLHVAGAMRVDSASDRKIDFIRTGGNHWSIEHDTSQIYFYNHTTSAAELIISNAGVVSGDLNDTSDGKLKENIKDLPSSIDNVLKLRPVMFDWKKNGDTKTGFIAQEVEKIFPREVVGKEYDEKVKRSIGKSINVTGLVAQLTKSIQEQQEIIEDLKKRIETLEK